MLAVSVETSGEIDQQAFPGCQGMQGCPLHPQLEHWKQKLKVHLLILLYNASLFTLQKLSNASVIP